MADTDPISSVKPGASPDLAAAPAAVPVPQAEAVSGPSLSPWAWVSLGMAGFALVASALVWQKLSRAQQELARQSADVAQQVQASRALSAQTETLTQELQARLGVAELRLSEVSLQRSQLEELMLSVSRSRDDSLVQDLESALQLALQQAQLTGSVQPLISALQAADTRIGRAAQPRLNPVQRAIVRDIDRIKAAALVDIPALTARFDELTRQVAEVPLANEPTTKSPTKPSAKPKSPPVSEVEASRWRVWVDAGWVTGQKWWSDLVAGASQLVRVSRLDRPEAALVAPDQAYFFRENLKLTLLNARMALLSRQMETSRSDTLRVSGLVQRYCDNTAPATQQLLEALTRLQGDMRDLVLPRPDETLAALAAAASGR
jgi:uroporphyrin-III C-methyltransferase